MKIKPITITAATARLLRWNHSSSLYVPFNEYKEDYIGRRNTTRNTTRGSIFTVDLEEENLYYTTLRQVIELLEELRGE